MMGSSTNRNDTPTSQHLDLLRAVNKARGSVKEVVHFHVPSGAVSAAEERRLRLAVRLLESVAASIKGRDPAVSAMIAAQQAASARAACYSCLGDELALMWDDEDRPTLEDLAPDVPFNALGEDDDIPF